MTQDQQLLSDFHALSPAKQAEVVDFIQRLKQKRNSSARKWQEIAGVGVFGGSEEDAQDWVSRQRQEADREIPPVS